MSSFPSDPQSAEEATDNPRLQLLAAAMRLHDPIDLLGVLGTFSGHPADSPEREVAETSFRRRSERSRAARELQAILEERVRRHIAPHLDRELHPLAECFARDPDVGFDLPPNPLRDLDDEAFNATSNLQKARLALNYAEALIGELHQRLDRVRAQRPAEQPRLDGEHRLAESVLSLITLELGELRAECEQSL